MAMPLFVLRQNIYTDPQVPIQVKPGLYPISNPDREFADAVHDQLLAHLLHRAGDIEKSKVPVWLQVVDTEGLSVLTAFAAGKLTSEGVLHELEKSGAKTKSKKNVLIIPGMVARMAPKLAELTGHEDHRRTEGIVRPAEDAQIARVTLQPSIDAYALLAAVQPR